MTALLFCMAGRSAAVAEESAAWNIVGTVRDENGKPMPGVTILAKSGEPGSVESFATKTDAEGNYTLPINPQKRLPAPVSDDVPDPSETDFRFLPLALSAERSDYDSKAQELIKFKDKSRSMKGDLIVIGDLVKQEDIDELKNRFADEKYVVVFVAKNEPYKIDFVMHLIPDNAPPSWIYHPNYWIDKAETDRRHNVYQKFGLIKPESELTEKVTVNLRFPKPEIMVGEPTNFDYIVRNDSDVDLWITVGGDYRSSGRPTSFTMRAVRKGGNEETTVYEIPVTLSRGGLMIGKKIDADGGEYAFDLCLSCWLDLKEPGEYRIDVARKLLLSEGDNPFLMRSRKGLSLPPVLRVASGVLTVKPCDEESFGKLIEHWGEQAMTESYGNAIDKLVHIEDKRVIPWLIKAADSRSGSYALSALTKFDDDAALATIAKDLESSDDAKSNSASANLARSVHPEAMGILLKNHRHPNFSVRMRAVQAARKMERNAALKMLREHFDDSGGDGVVGSEARRIYKELTGNDPE